MTNRSHRRRRWWWRSFAALCWLTLLVPSASAAAVRSAGVSVGLFLPPVAPVRVLVPFAPPADPYGAGHRGVDLAVAAGAPVRAAGAGRVVYAGQLAGRGVVSIEHPSGLRTTYEPVTATVTAGSSVVAGELIGVLEDGHPPCSPATCLHWGAKVGERYLDPMALLTGWRVRLLPWDG